MWPMGKQLIECSVLIYSWLMPDFPPKGLANKKNTCVASFGSAQLAGLEG
jgi:hypothetical protein